jgi:hypothetical protein
MKIPIFDPEDPVALIWGFIHFLLIFLYIFYIPIELCFLRSIGKSFETNCLEMTIISI